MAVAVEYSMNKVGSLEELAIELNCEYDTKVDIWDRFEEANPDFSFYQDVNFDSLVETLTYNGITEEQISTFSMALYGPVIDFYQVGAGEDVMYVMGVGQR